MQNILPADAHIFSQGTESLDPLFARLERGAKEKTQKIGERRQGCRDDDIPVRHPRHCCENKGSNTHHRWHDRPARRGCCLHAASEYPRKATLYHHWYCQNARR